MQIKATMRYQSTSCLMAKMKNTDDTKVWQWCRETGSLIHCWWENDTVILEDSLAVPHKLKYSLTLQLSNHTLLWAFVLEKWKTCSQKYQYRNIHGSCICDGQKLETSQMFFIVWIDKYAVVHPYNKVLLTDLSQAEIGLISRNHFRLKM